MSSDSTAVDFGINLLEEEIDDVIFRTNEFLTDATFTGGQGPFWWIIQMSMALAGLFAIIMCANMAYKMMVKREPPRCDETLQAFGGEYRTLLVVPTSRYRYSRRQQHLVCLGLP